MATSAVVVSIASPTVRIWDIIFVADGDLELVLAHGMPAIPLVKILEPLLPAYYLNSIHISAIDATNVTITGLNVGGAGNANPQARLTLMAPHTIM